MVDSYQAFDSNHQIKAVPTEALKNSGAGRPSELSLSLSAGVLRLSGSTDPLQINPEGPTRDQAPDHLAGKSVKGSTRSTGAHL